MNMSISTYTKCSAPDQTVEGRDAPPTLMPERSARGKRPAVTITLDDHDVPILPTINKNSKSKDLQSIFRDFVTAHYSKPSQVKLTRYQ